MGIYCLQWDLDPSANEVELLVNSLNVNMPDIGIEVTSQFLSDTSAQSFTDLISEDLSNGKDIQIIYISAHGTSSGLSPAENLGPCVSYKELGDLLKEGDHGKAGLEIVFGSCKAMSNEVSIEQYLPQSVKYCWGFTGSPTGHSVLSLMTKVINHNIDLYKSLSSGCGVPDHLRGAIVPCDEPHDDSDDICHTNTNIAVCAKQVLEPIIDSYEEKLISQSVGITDAESGSVVLLLRDQNNCWQKYVLPECFAASQ